MWALFLVPKVHNFILFARSSKTSTNTTEVDPHSDSMHNGIVKPKNVEEWLAFLTLDNKTSVIFGDVCVVRPLDLLDKVFKSPGKVLEFYLQSRMGTLIQHIITIRRGYFCHRLLCLAAFPCALISCCCCCCCCCCWCCCCYTDFLSTAHLFAGFERSALFQFIL